MSFWEEKPHDSSLPNILPLVEVSLFLVTALIANAASGTMGELLVAPATVTEAQRRGEAAPVLRISVQADGSYLDWGDPISANELKAKIGGLPPSARVEIVPDKAATSQAIAPVMSAAYARGIMAVWAVEDAGEGSDR